VPSNAVKGQKLSFLATRANTPNTKILLQSLHIIAALVFDLGHSRALA
jgi:hypothetical protein